MVSFNYDVNHNRILLRYGSTNLGIINSVLSEGKSQYDTPLYAAAGVSDFGNDFSELIAVTFESELDSPICIFEDYDERIGGFALLTPFLGDDLERRLDRIGVLIATKFVDASEGIGGDFERVYVQRKSGLVYAPLELQPDIGGNVEKLDMVGQLVHLYQGIVNEFLGEVGTYNYIRAA